jgi:hypothetical protein
VDESSAAFLYFRKPAKEDFLMEELDNVVNQPQDEIIEEQQTDTPEIDNENANPDTTQEEEFDVITYNKEEVRIPASERQTYLQKGYNYDKIKSRADELEQQTGYLSKVAQLSGFTDTAEFIKAVEEAEEKQRIHNEAQKLGIDEDAYRQHIEPVSSKLTQMESELEEFRKQESFRQVEQEINSLKSKYDDFEKNQDRVIDLAMQHGYRLEDAYKIATYEEKLESISKQKEQEVLARVTGRDEKQVLASNDKPSDTSFDPSNMSLDDIEKISERVRRGERITF